MVEPRELVERALKLVGALEATPISTTPDMKLFVVPAAIFKQMAGLVSFIPGLARKIEELERGHSTNG
jgi:hypothetical protein